MIGPLLGARADVPTPARENPQSTLPVLGDEEIDPSQYRRGALTTLLEQIPIEALIDYIQHHSTSNPLI